MKLVIAIASIILSLQPRLLLAQGRFSLRLQGGWAYLSGGDVNPGTRAFFDWREAMWGASEFGYQAVHNGFELGGEVVFELSQRLGVGIGAGYLEISRPSDLYLYDPVYIGPEETVIAEPRLSAVPIQASIHFSAPLTKKFNFHAEAGASYYFKARYSDESWVRLWSMDTEAGYIHINTSAEQKKLPIGAFGGIGLEYDLQHNLSLLVEVRGRYARFRGSRGTSVLESDYRMPFSEQGVLYYEVVPALTDMTRLLMVQSSPPDGPDGEPRQAVIDFSGVSLQVGIRIRL